jgi:UDP-N-acetylmuramyl pentapeptide phosphotransferase/UDP-N-acetylglucosamine-1-phosphate transferase
VQLWSVIGFVVAIGAASISYGFILLLFPLLYRYASAPPTVRSSHICPTPQGGGAAIIVAIIIVISATAVALPALNINQIDIFTLLAASAALTVVGAIDDIRTLGVTPRLLLQSIAIVAVIAVLPDTLRVLPVVPPWMEPPLLLVAGLWFVNLVNFMDGIDWMTVAEVVPLTAGIALFGFIGALPHSATIVALALCGATIGFAPFNHPVARLFLGDAGSLPIGLLLGWLLVLLAGSGYLTAALLLPLYYLADATITLILRLVRGDSILEPHRTHFYQRARDGGLEVYQIVGRVFATNIILVALAFATLVYTSSTIHLLALTAGSVLVGALLWYFSHVKREKTAFRS